MPAEPALQLKEVLPKMGMIHRSTYHQRHLESADDKKKADSKAEMTLDMVLCKPKLLPMKSVTLEKLEKMQKDAQETVKQQEKQAQMEAIGGYNNNTNMGGFTGMGGGIGDISDNPYDFN